MTALLIASLFVALVVFVYESIANPHHGLSWNALCAFGAFLILPVTRVVFGIVVWLFS